MSVRLGSEFSKQHRGALLALGVQRCLRRRASARDAHRHAAGTDVELAVATGVKMLGAPAANCSPLMQGVAPWIPAGLSSQ